MEYELSLLYQMIIEAAHDPKPDAQTVSFFNRLMKEKERIKQAFRSFEASAKDIANDPLLNEYINRHYAMLMDFEEPLANVDEPFYGFLMNVVSELKFFLSIHFHSHLLDAELEPPHKIIVNCNDEQMGKVISMLSNMKLINTGEFIDIPRSGFQIRIAPELYDGQPGRIFEKGFISKLFRRMR